MMGVRVLYPGSFVVGWQFLGKRNDEGEYELEWFELSVGFIVFLIFIGDM